MYHVVIFLSPSITDEESVTVTQTLERLAVDSHQTETSIGPMISFGCPSEESAITAARAFGELPGVASAYTKPGAVVASDGDTAED